MQDGTPHEKVKRENKVNLLGKLTRNGGTRDS